jgi:integrase/recombinase XerD
MITKPIIESYQRYMFRYRKEDGKPLSWCSQSMHIAEVNNFFRYLVKFNHLPFNPASEVELPKKPKSLPKAILSPDEVERILAEPDLTSSFGLRDRAIFELLYSSGIRRAELCNLRLEHVDVERKAIFINQGKGQKDRYVPVGLRALLWIARYVENVRDKLLLDKKEPTLFLTKDGTPMNPDSLTEYARRYIESSGVEKPGACHIFRHTMATLMHENGADIRYIQAILGHERLETTQIYTRTSLRKLLEVHEQTHPAERPDEESATDTESTS